MRALVLVALLVASGCLEARAEDFSSLPHGGPVGGVGGFEGFSGRTITPAAPPIMLYDYAPGLSTVESHDIPDCTVANNCAAQCVASGTGDAWQCRQGDGTAITVSVGTGAAQQTPWASSYAVQVASDANASSISGANSDPITDVLSGEHTIVWTGYDRYASSAAFPWEVWTSTAKMYLRLDSGNSRCLWTNLAGTPTTAEVQVTAVTPREYGMVACRKSGTGGSSDYTTWVNRSAEKASTAWGYDPESYAGATIYFGRHGSPGAYMRGHMESWTLYSTDLSDAELDALQARWSGKMPTVYASATGALAGSGSGRTWMEDPSGQWLPMMATTPRVSSDGIWIEEHSSVTGNGANWAADNLDASSWTAIGTPTTTTNHASGPFSRWGGGVAEADRIVDDDAGAFEGYTAPINCQATPQSTTESVTVSCFLKEGDSGTTTTKARLGITTNGTGSTTCDHTITSSWDRYSCTASIAGGATATYGQIMVGNAASETGSVIVSQCQCDRDGWVNSPHVTSGAVGMDNYTTASGEASAWSTTAGSYQIIFRPDFSHGDMVDNEDTYEPVDVYNAAETDHWVLGWQYYDQNPSMGTRGSGQPVGSTDTYADSDPEIEAGHLYAFKVKWKDVGGGRAHHWIYFNECLGSVDSCSATTLIGSDTTGDKYGPSGAIGGWQVGCRYSNQLCMEGHILRFSVWNDP